MALLPREQVTQRHPRACVSAPGVNLWASQTNLALCLVTNTDEVVEGEVELAASEPPMRQWFVESGFLGQQPGEEPWGLYQWTAFGEGLFGEGVFGGFDLVHAMDESSLSWSFTNEDDA